jgi:hypothetical protein
MGSRSNAGLGRCILNSKIGEKSTCPYFTPCSADRDMCRHVGARETYDEQGKLTRIGGTVKCRRS